MFFFWDWMATSHAYLVLPSFFLPSFPGIVESTSGITLEASSNPFFVSNAIVDHFFIIFFKKKQDRFSLPIASLFESSSQFYRVFFYRVFLESSNLPVESLWKPLPTRFSYPMPLWTIFSSFFLKKSKIDFLYRSLHSSRVPTGFTEFFLPSFFTEFFLNPPPPNIPFSHPKAEEG